MKIHLGCGRHVLEGYYNVDIVQNPGAPRPVDLLSSIDKLPALKDECATEVLTVHAIEHMTLGQALLAMREWNRILKPGGVLIIECPDVMKCAKNLLEGSRQDYSMWGIYGNPDEGGEPMRHKWGWTFKTLEHELKLAGFSKIVERPTEWHGKRVSRDVRVEAKK